MFECPSSTEENLTRSFRACVSIDLQETKNARRRAVPSPAKLRPVISRGACGRHRDLIRGLSGQQIVDCHSRAAVPIEYNDITGFDFFLHRVAAGIQRTTSPANRSAKFACADQNIRRALPGRMFQLSTNRPEFSFMTGILAPPPIDQRARRHTARLDALPNFAALETPASSLQGFELYRVSCVTRTTERQAGSWHSRFGSTAGRIDRNPNSEHLRHNRGRGIRF